MNMDANSTNSTDQQSEPLKFVAPCPECQTGVQHLQYLTYFTWLNDELVTVPNFPAWVCDLCGRREYDPRAITWLNTLLNPETGRKADKRRRQMPVRRISRRPQPPAE
jgi:YgiT-type zinc finger domain-containing protein